MVWALKEEADIVKNGFRIYDTDTHIDPGSDVLEKYVDPGFRPRLGCQVFAGLESDKRRC